MSWSSQWSLYKTHEHTCQTNGRVVLVHLCLKMEMSEIQKIVVDYICRTHVETL
jgi:hypothetical protein